jgi:hypothetical protein
MAAETEEYEVEEEIKKEDEKTERPHDSGPKQEQPFPDFGGFGPFQHSSGYGFYPLNGHPDMINETLVLNPLLPPASKACSAIQYNTGYTLGKFRESISIGSREPDDNDLIIKGIEELLAASADETESILKKYIKTFEDSISFDDLYRIGTIIGTLRSAISAPHLSGGENNDDKFRLYCRSTDIFIKEISLLMHKYIQLKN